MNENRSHENVQEYRRLKGIAQKTIKNSAANTGETTVIR